MSIAALKIKDDNETTLMGDLEMIVKKKLTVDEDIKAFSDKLKR